MDRIILQSGQSLGDFPVCLLIFAQEQSWDSSLPAVKILLSRSAYRWDQLICTVQAYDPCLKSVARFISGARVEHTSKAFCSGSQPERWATYLVTQLYAAQFGDLVIPKISLEYFCSYPGYNPPALTWSEYMVTGSCIALPHPNARCSNRELSRTCGVRCPTASSSHSAQGTLETSDRPDAAL